MTQGGNLLSVPFFLFPTEAILYDPDANFGEIIKKVLAQTVRLSIVHQGTQTFLESIEQKLDRYHCALHQYTNAMEKETLSKSAFAHAFNKISAQLKEQGLLSLLIMNAQLFKSNGDVAKHLFNVPNLRKILLTDPSLGVMGGDFPHEAIDALIQKQDTNFFNRIHTEIQDIIWKFFLHLSNALLPSWILNTIPDYPFKKEAFGLFLQDLLKNHQMTDLHLIGFCGTFRLRDRAGKKYVFSIRKGEDFHFYHDLGKSLGVSRDLLDKVHARTHIPLLMREEHPRLTWENFGHLMRPVQSFKVLDEPLYVVFLENNRTQKSVPCRSVFGAPLEVRAV